MSEYFHRGRGRDRRSSRGTSQNLLDDSDPRPLGPNDFEIQEHVWDQPVRLDGGQGPCPVHASTHSIWRPVRQDSRESRAIFGSESQPPCPVHARPLSTGCSMHSMRSINTALSTADDVVVVPPQAPEESAPAPDKPTKESRSRHSTGRSRSRSQSGTRSYHGSQCSMHSRSRTTFSYSTGIRSGGEGGSGGKSLITFLKEFYDKYPRIATALAVLVFLYFFIHQLDVTIAHIFECFIRIIYPTSHYVAVTNEQFFARLSRMATRGDEMMEAFYCDFARTWCQRFELMCDVRCSFVEQTLQRIRKYPH